MTTGSNNVCLGYEAGRDQITTATNQLYIARDNVASSNPQVWIYGNGQGACHQELHHQSYQVLAMPLL